MNPIPAPEPISIDTLTQKVIGAALEVSNTLGAGFLEKVYERALLHELKLQGLHATTQTMFSVLYKGHSVGHYCSDILVENTLVIELKCTDQLTGDHLAQCLNYLKASGKNLCLLFNFQKPTVEWKRVVLNL